MRPPAAVPNRRGGAGRAPILVDAPGKSAPLAARARNGNRPRTRWQALTKDSARHDGDGFAPSPDTGSVAPTYNHVEAVGRALQSSFAEILRRLPARVGKVAQVARWLDLDRSICQRVVMGVRDAGDGLGVLERFPGVRGLEQFIDAAAARGVPASAIKDAHRALDHYARLVSNAGGSQARLVGELEVLRAEQGSHRVAVTASPSDLEKWRKKCYEGTVGLTGLASRARVELVLVKPSEIDRDSMTTVTATGFIGVESAAYAMPLVRKSRLPGLTPVPAPIDAEGHTRPPSGLSPDILLKPFTTDPLPRLTMRTEGEHLIQTIDTEPAQSRPIDIVAALSFNWRWSNKTTEGSNYYSVGRIIGAPARRLVFDVYLHHKLPAPKSVTAHVIRPGTHGSLGDARPQSRWFDRLPAEHELTLLSGSPGDRSSIAYERLGELTKHLVETMHWNGEAFTGYRFELAYPIFDLEYVIAAEF